MPATFHGFSRAYSCVMAVALSTWRIAERPAGLPRLRAITPPESVAAQHDKLVKAIDDYGREVESAVNTLKNPTASRLLDAQQKLLDATQTVTRQINATIDQINTKLRS